MDDIPVDGTSCDTGFRTAHPIADVRDEHVAGTRVPITDRACIWY
jgi:hypothetical protein